LLLHDYLLQAFEDRFTFGEREAHRGGGEVNACSMGGGYRRGAKTSSGSPQNQTLSLPCGSYQTVPCRAIN
jgi:hypothetical protein